MSGQSETTRPVVVVGRGLIGSAVRDRLARSGCPVVTVSRESRPGPHHRARDLATPEGRAALRADLAELAPRHVVLTHGPSDVTWMQEHEDEAAAVHCGVAAAVVDAAVPTVLVSTDNVFAGDRGGVRAGDPIRPGNAYGRIKAETERLLAAADSTLALRVSLVYGSAGARHRPTFGQRCLAAASRGEKMRAPDDQFFTPIHIDDVAEVIARLCLAPDRPTGVRHLAGPDELSRYEFAVLAYALAGADPALVQARPRAATEWASRPRFSSLATSDFSEVAGLAGWAPMTPADGLRRMLAERGPAVGR